jgi:prophage DNA circulation protein
MAVFTIEITEAPPQAPAPTAAPDLGAEVDVAADAALVAVEAELAETFDVEGQPSFAVASLAEELQGRAQGMRDALGPVVATTQELALLDQETQLLVAQASSIVREPADTMAGLLGAMGALTDTLAESPRAVVAALVETYGVAPVATAVGTTATREQERTNQEALAAALRRVLAIEAARLLPTVVYETLDEAQSDVAIVVELLDEQALTAGDTAYPALVALRAALTRAVPGDAVLARVVTVERPVAVPALLLSYQLYGSLDKEEDLVQRNRVQHPGFLSGLLQALSHG